MHGLNLTILLCQSDTDKLAPGGLVIRGFDSQSASKDNGKSRGLNHLLDTDRSQGGTLSEIGLSEPELSVLIQVKVELSKVYILSLDRL